MHDFIELPATDTLLASTRRLARDILRLSPAPGVDAHPYLTADERASIQAVRRMVRRALHLGNQTVFVTATQFGLLQDDLLARLPDADPPEQSHNPAPARPD